MILDEYINIRWNQNNKKQYIEKGYVLTKIGEMFNVKTIDLLSSSHVLIHVKCDICGKEKFMIYREYLSNFENGKYFCCSRKCRDRKASCRERVSSPV